MDVCYPLHGVLLRATFWLTAAVSISLEFHARSWYDHSCCLCGPVVVPCCPALLPCPAALRSYGIGLTTERFRLTKGLSWGPITPLPGLLLTGQDTVGNGVVLAWKSGILAAQLAGGPRVSLWMGKEVVKALIADLAGAKGG